MEFFLTLQFPLEKSFISFLLMFFFSSAPSARGTTLGDIQSVWQDSLMIGPEHVKLLRSRLVLGTLRAILMVLGGPLWASDWLWIPMCALTC